MSRRPRQGVLRGAVLVCRLCLPRLGGEDAGATGDRCPGRSSEPRSFAPGGAALSGHSHSRYLGAILWALPTYTECLDLLLSHTRRSEDSARGTFPFFI